MAQLEMVRQPVERQEDLREGFDDVKEMVQRTLETRRRTIDVLRQQASRADRIHQGCAASNRYANITGVAGGGLAILAGGITIASGGLAFPMVVGGLTFCGATFSVGGGAWSMKNEYDKGQRSSNLQQEILQQLAEDEKALNKMHNMICKVKEGYFGEPRKVFRELHIFLAGLGAIGMVKGSETALEILNQILPAIAYLISGSSSAILLSLVRYLPMIAGKGAVEGVDDIAQQSAASAVKFMHSGLSKDFVQREALKAAQKAYTEFLEEVSEKAAAEAAKKVAKEGGNIAAIQAAQQTAKESAVKAATETATKAARSAAKSVVEQSAKTAARVTGSVTAGFGVLTSVWEGYNAYQNHCETQKESPFGKELRDLADSLENQLEARFYVPA